MTTVFNGEIQAGLWHDGDYREVRGLNQVFRTKRELKAKGYAFAFKYGSEALAKAMAWLDFPDLREIRKRIETGPLDLRDALDAAFVALDDPSKTLRNDHTFVLKEHTGGWFSAAAEVRRLLLALQVGQ